MSLLDKIPFALARMDTPPYTPPPPPPKAKTKTPTTTTQTFGAGCPVVEGPVGFASLWLKMGLDPLHKIRNPQVGSATNLNPVPSGIAMKD